MKKHIAHDIQFMEDPSHWMGRQLLPYAPSKPAAGAEQIKIFEGYRTIELPGRVLAALLE